MFARAYEIALATNDPSSAEISLGHLGRNAMLSGDNVEAERIFRKTLQLAQELHNLRGIRVQLTNLTEALIRLGRYSEAESTLKESEKRNIEANDSIGLAWNLKHHGQIEKAQGRIETGNQYIQQGLDKLQKIDNKEYLSEFQAALRGEIQIPPESD